MGQGRHGDLDFRKSLGPGLDLMLLPEVRADHLRIQPGVMDLDTNPHPAAGGSPSMLCFQVVPGSPEQLQLGGLLLPGLFTPILLPGVKPVSSAHCDGGHFHLHPNQHIRTSTMKLLGLFFKQQVSRQLLNRNLGVGGLFQQVRTCACVCFSSRSSLSLSQLHSIQKRLDGPCSELKQTTWNPSFTWCCG